MTLQRTTGPSRAKAGGNRAIDEMLGDVEYFFAGEGPDGPWSYKSLSVRREENRLLVSDVDGQLAACLGIVEVPNGDDAAPFVRQFLNRIHEETLDDL